MDKKLIVSNWKQYVTTLAQAQGLLEAVDEQLSGRDISKEQSGLVFCPPFVLIEEVSNLLVQSHLRHQAELGAQDIAASDQGGMTGEVSGTMLSKLSVRYVIVGHSERRWKLGETDSVVNEKLQAVLRNGLVPIVCLGERDRTTQYKDFLREQTEKTFGNLTADDVARCIIAYEPVWAISSTPGAKPDTPSSALESLTVIRNVLQGGYGVSEPQFLYGGSITAENIQEFISHAEFAGVLIGHASTKRDEFVKILSTVFQ